MVVVLWAKEGGEGGRGRSWETVVDLAAAGLGREWGRKGKSVGRAAAVSGKGNCELEDGEEICTQPFIGRGGHGGQAGR